MRVPLVGFVSNSRTVIKCVNMLNTVALFRKDNSEGQCSHCILNTFMLFKSFTKIMYQG